jgi:hypothetical protein
MKSASLAAMLCASAMTCVPFSAFAWNSGVCTQGNSFALLTSGSTVTAYIPNAFWEGGATGVRVVTIEGTGPAPVTISTPGAVNTCSADQALQEVVCVANDNDVYLIKGSTLVATLESSGSGYIDFSGGTCTNCNVAVNSVTHVAYIGESLNYSPAVQPLNISDQTFQTPFPLSNGISESLVIDTVRNLVLSATEQSIYDVLQISKTGTAEYGNSDFSAEYDSPLEDCVTGLAIGSDEFTGNLMFANLHTATFNSGTMTWTDTEEALINYPEFDNLAAGTTGLSLAQGTHYGVVAGEFGGNLEGFIRTPSSAADAASGLVNYVVATLPNDPGGYAFANGFDPHSEASYVSPNNSKAYAIFVDWADGSPDYLAVADIAGVLGAPRVISNSGGKHEVNPSYDLLGHGIVKYIRTY